MISQDVDYSVTDNYAEFNLAHVESSYVLAYGRYADVYVCHGGFVPPIQEVQYNIRNSTKIISVAKWVADKYFSEYWDKTEIIPNGLILSDFDNIPDMNVDPYFMYGKEWDYYFDDFMYLVYKFPEYKFVTTFYDTAKYGHNPDNLYVIGNRPRHILLQYLKNAHALIMTGSEVNPIMLLEAWALNVPVIGRNSDGCKEVMVHGGQIVGGYIVDDFYNSRSMKYILNSVIKYHAEFGEIGRNIVEKKYDWNLIWNQYKEVYNELIRSNQSS